MNKCTACPVSDDSLACRAGTFCGWASAPTPDPVHVRHIRAVALLDADRPLPPQAAVPCGEAMAIRATPSIPLAGDLVASLTASFGVDRLAKWTAKQLGTDCGCSGRQAKLNELDAKARRLLGRLSRGSAP